MCGGIAPSPPRAQNMPVACRPQDGPPRESRPRSGSQFRCPLELAQGLYGVPVAKESQNVTAIVLQDGKWDFTHTGTHTLAWDRSPHFLHGLANMRNVM